MDIQPAQHSYGTRIRHNITIKPSARLRQSPDPPPLKPNRKLKAIPTTTTTTTPATTQQDSSNSFNYPFPNVILHPDDANSKVFLAIARSFLSVENRAMTIKDLAEMTTQFGLVCQNVSAASQAITTYIRTHLQRCDAQQDQPLLLRHVLYGTSTDDDLLPALHSRSGGSHGSCPDKKADDRSTNFRKGTTVWYLSRATGAPCPFSRAGIRLCDYVESAKEARSEGKLSKREGKRQRQRERESRRIAARAEAEVAMENEQCGQKRKRRSLRASMARSSSYSSDDASSSEPSEDERPPPPSKIKLTLRLKPLAQVTASIAAAASSRPVVDLGHDFDSDDDMSVDGSSGSDSAASSDEDEDLTSTRLSPPKASTAEIDDKPCLPPYPRRSISIPTYTPSADFHSYSSYPSYTYRRSRSPSIPYSMASPPPESDDENVDFHVGAIADPRASSSAISPAGRRRVGGPYNFPSPREADMDYDSNFDEFYSSDIDGISAQGSSPGPRSPSMPLLPLMMSSSSTSAYSYPYASEPRVKEEPTDVQGILDAWEDLDHLRQVECGKPLSVPDVIEVIGSAAAFVLEGTQNIKREDTGLEKWGWESGYKDFSSSTPDPSPFSSSSPASFSSVGAGIKSEDDSDPAPSSSLAPTLDFSFQNWRSPGGFNDPYSHADGSLSPLSAVSPTSPLSDQGMFSPFGLGFSSPESPTTSHVLRRESELHEASTEFATIRPRAKTVPALPGLGSFFGLIPASEESSSPSPPPTATLPPPPSTAPAQITSSSAANAFHPLTALIHSLSLSINPTSPSAYYPRASTSQESQPACVAPREMDIRILGARTDVRSDGVASVLGEDAVTVNTCTPCEPEIKATQVEGISVYRSTLGSHVLLRRIDTDFVNLTPILAYSGSPCPVLSTIPHAVLLTQGSDIIQGMWVPLSAAQAYVKDHPPASTPPCTGLDIFLSDDLVQKFPSALREVVSGIKDNGSKLNGQFGKGFGSMVQARDVAGQVQNTAPVAWENPQSLSLSLPSVDIGGNEMANWKEAPLSPGEREIFHALCISSEWDKENFEASTPSSPVTSHACADSGSAKPLSIITSSACNSSAPSFMDTDDEPLTPIDASPCARSESIEPERLSSGKGRPLRRSRRVADAAAAAKTRTRIRRKDSRSMS